MSVINTNVKSLIVQNAIKVNNRLMANAMEQLSTGRRINSAKDDAAGLAISENMTSQIRGMDMAVRNANDGVSLLQTAEGAMIEQTNMLQRMRELSVQAANGTLSSTQRSYLDLEFQALVGEINRISQNTQWNGMKLLSGTQGSGNFQIQVGPGNRPSIETISITINNMSFQTNSASVVGVFGPTVGGVQRAWDATAYPSTDGITTITAAKGAIAVIDDALDAIAQQRATIGATINRLTYAADNLSNISMNTSASRSRILDTDYAVATTELARTQIIQQASTAVLAQANSQPQTVLKLLQG
jgi:flagellin